MSRAAARPGSPSTTSTRQPGRHRTLAHRGSKSTSARPQHSEASKSTGAGRRPQSIGSNSSPDGETWELLCRTRHGEGGQDVFAFPPTGARLVRLVCEEPFPERGLEIVEVNLYSPADAASVREDGPRRRARSRPGQAFRWREHHGRLRLRALAARGADRMGGELRNRLLGASLRRRRDLPRGRPHRDRRRGQRQLLVALHDEPLPSPDSAPGERARRRRRQRTQAAHPQQGSHADRPARIGRRAPAVATFTRSRCSAARSIGRRSASSIRAIRRCSTNMATSNRGATRLRSRRFSGSAAPCMARPRLAPSATRWPTGSLPIPSVVWSAHKVERTDHGSRPRRTGAGGSTGHEPQQGDADGRARSDRAPCSDQSVLAARRPRVDHRDRRRRTPIVGQRPSLRGVFARSRCCDRRRVRRWRRRSG